MKSTVLIILLVAVALSVAFFIFSKPSPTPSQEDAKKFFLEDLKEKYPAAEVREVMEITAMNASDGTLYYQLQARVTKGLSTPCPERLHVHYDYPPKNFVAQPPEYITKGCKVCLNEPICILAFPEEAIIASHTYPGAEAVSAFLKDNSDAKSEATFVDSYENQTAVWLVKWSSASSGKSYIVAVSKSQNKVLAVSGTN